MTCSSLIGDSLNVQHPSIPCWDQATQDLFSSCCNYDDSRQEVRWNTGERGEEVAGTRGIWLFPQFQLTLNIVCENQGHDHSLFLNDGLGSVTMVTYSTNPVFGSDTSTHILTFSHDSSVMKPQWKKQTNEQKSGKKTFDRNKWSKFST